MSTPKPFTRIASLKTIEQFRACVAELGLDLPADDRVLQASESPFSRPVESATINGKRIGNRLAIHPMEGWDGTTSGGITPEVVRRWQRFGESGAKLIFGGEAMAVRPDGRANPNQLMALRQNLGDLVELREALTDAHRRDFGSDKDLVIGFQLTHSGRFCKPTDKTRMEPRVAYRHPILDRRFNVTSDAQVWTDDEIDRLIEDYVEAARVARDAGADFVDIKHCHGYLLHEFLSACTRPGKYGGSLENRTRILRELIQGIRASGNNIDIAVRVSAFDFVPFRPDPALSQPGKPGPGIPEEFSSLLPYKYGFGCNQQNPLEPDLTEPLEFLRICHSLGVKIVNLSAGSPYYNPHILRPAAYPPSDGYQPPEDPLVGVARQIQAARWLKERAPVGLLLLGTGYSYLQEYLPHVAQAALRQNWIDIVGIGRVVLSYPRIIADALEKGELVTKQICRTFSDCTTGPRKGLISGCYPLDPYYATKPEAQQLKQLKRG